MRNYGASFLLGSCPILYINVYTLDGGQFFNTHLDKSAEREPISLPKGSQFLSIRGLRPIILQDHLLRMAQRLRQFAWLQLQLVSFTH
jgi:hypothetical protein